MKQTCDICQKERKGKHFGWTSVDTVWCDKCIAKCPPPPFAGTRSLGQGPALLQLQMTKHQPFYMMNRADWAKHGFHPGVITKGEPLRTPSNNAEGEPKKERKSKGTRITSTDGLETSGLKRLELQLKFGLSDDGKLLSEKERTDIQRQIDGYSAEPVTDEDEDEAAAILSILKGTP